MLATSRQHCLPLPIALAAAALFGALGAAAGAVIGHYTTRQYWAPARLSPR